LVSTVRGVLAEGVDAIKTIKACFPGGSITGAPKIRAMNIIDELEPDHRGIYCGSLLYFNVAGNCDSNIAIRTLIIQDNHVTCSAGGGIVADSQCENEYQETFDKVGALLKTLENNQH